ncbi:hypothetical protein L596_029320 [Steinernema carpocapsae]|uniref:Uncharacterized protein n=1 Tax=Steinernema carpocapsae TaxID=34508 RepID=A0A4U5LUA9_STECR|nr:hypothetical protein L596_029320 [Steinernema carpocapsae]
MSQQNHSNLIERIRFGIDIARIALPPICLPVYLLLIFHTKESFKNLVAFKLIVSLALMDCFYLIQTFTNGIFTTFAPHLVEDSALPDSHPLRIFIKVISSTRIGHLVAVPLLNFILALNRLTVMANKKYWTIWRKGYKVPYIVVASPCLIFQVFIVVAWIIYIPGMMTLQFAIPGVEFDLAVFGYTYHGPYSLKCVISHARQRPKTAPLQHGAAKNHIASYLPTTLYSSDLGTMDCLYLLQSFVKGSLTLFVSHLFEKDALPENQPMLIVIRVISSLRIGHLLAVPFLTLVLAVNRLSVMLNKKYNWKKNKRFMAANTIAWIIYIPLVLILNFAHTGIEFFMTLDSFVYDGPLYFKCILAYGGPACEIGAFLCMVGVVICIVIKSTFFQIDMLRLAQSHMKKTLLGNKDMAFIRTFSTNRF